MAETNCDCGRPTKYVTTLPSNMVSVLMTKLEAEQLHGAIADMSQWHRGYLAAGGINGPLGVKELEAFDAKLRSALK